MRSRMQINNAQMLIIKLYISYAMLMNHFDTIQHFKTKTKFDTQRSGSILTKFDDDVI